jgi:acetyl esterase
VSRPGRLHPRIAAALAAAQGVAPYHTRPVAQARALARAGYPVQDPPVPVGAVRELAVPAAHGVVRVRLYTPAGAAQHPLLVFFHGSGFVMLDLDTHDDLCRRLCAGAACAVASVDYRLAPEHPFPAGPDDCLVATRWLTEHASEFGCDARRLVLAGDSAGGCLAVVTAARLRDEGGANGVGQLLFYPVLDLPPEEPQGSYAEFATGFGLSHAGMAWFWRQYLAHAAQREDPLAVPARLPSVAGLPPAHITVAEFDVLRDEGEAYARRLQQAGIAVDLERAAGMNHGFLKYAPDLPDAAACVEHACRWLRERFA